MYRDFFMYEFFSVRDCVAIAQITAIQFNKKKKKEEKDARPKKKNIVFFRFRLGDFQ